MVSEVETTISYCDSSLTTAVRLVVPLAATVPSALRTISTGVKNPIRRADRETPICPASQAVGTPNSRIQAEYVIRMAQGPAFAAKLSNCMAPSSAPQS